MGRQRAVTDGDESDDEVMENVDEQEVDTVEDADGRGTRRSGRVKNKPKYTIDDEEDATKSASEAEDDDTGRKKKKAAPKVGRRKGTDEDEEEDAYQLSSAEDSEVSEEYEVPSDSLSSSEYGDVDVEGGEEEEEWDRQRMRFVAVSRSANYADYHPYYRPAENDLPPFLAEAVNRAAATRPMAFQQGGQRPSVLTPEQIQEIAKNTVSTLASVNPITGRKLPLLLPRAPIDQADQIKSAVSEELKQSITSLLLDPSTREAMIRRLHGASAVSQRAAMGPGQPFNPAMASLRQPVQRPVPPPRPMTHLAPRRIVKERSAAEEETLSRPRRTPAKKVDYSSFFKEDEEEEGGGEGSEGESEEDQGVEKILLYRKLRGGQEEFHVKYWQASYLHCEWVPRDQLEEERGMASRIKKFLARNPKPSEDIASVIPKEFTTPQRIVFGWNHPDEDSPGKTATSFLVKWVGLAYEDSTWEKEETIWSISGGPELLKEYSQRPGIDDKRFGALPVGRRPAPSDWKPFEESPIYKDSHTLRSYQLEGVNWLVYCWMNKQSCIIADEMGLGKTVQSVAFMDLLYKSFRVRGPFLIVCPLSTLPHWQREFAAWTDLNVIVYHGSKPSRDVMYEYEFFFKNPNDQPIPGFTRFDVLITTYEMAMAGIEQLTNVTWRVGVFDEAHRLKNRASKAADVLKTLEIEHKILLSGTPIQNSIGELWSLLNFLQPQRFYSEEEFLEEHGDLSTAEDVERLQELLKPLMLRRLKEDVEKTIPVKEETIIEVELTPVQKRYYRAILERNFAFLTQGCTASNAPNLLNAMMELRKCCIHPYLISGAEDRITEELGVTKSDVHAVHNAMVQASGKLVLVDKLLRKLREGGHRVLIFSQMTKCLDILADFLRWRGYSYERIDGAIKGSDRQAAIDRFCDLERDSFVFLLCTRAGGVGINLTAADTVVIYDSDWNPQNDLQAQARCHRIGQTRSVKIYRLITRNTYERDMFDRAGMKLGLDRAVLQKMVGLPLGSGEDSSTGPSATSGMSTQLSRKEVETLLKKGAYGVLMETTDDAANRFCEEDIDQILERRTTVIRHDEPGAGQAEAGRAGSSIFSKASFTATAADDFDIDIDDPNFWELWAKKLELNPRALLAASSAATGAGGAVDEPRVKRLIKRLKTVELEIPEWDDSPIDDLVSKVPPARAKKAASQEVAWTEAERKLLVRQLAFHGIGRFSDLPSLFPARTKNDIIAAAKALIKASIDFVASQKDESDDKFKEDAEKAILWKIDFDKVSKKDKETEDLSGFAKHEIPFIGASKLQCLEFKSFLQDVHPDKLQSWLSAEQARRLVLRVQLLEMVRQIVERQATAPGGLKSIPVPGNVAGAPMPEWWGRDADVDLIIGTFRHGYGAYDLMRADPESVFSTMKYRDSTDPATVANQDALYEWPSNADLGGRLRKLLVNMEKRAQVASKLAQHHVELGERRRSAAPSATATPIKKKRRANESSEEEESEEEVTRKRRGGRRSAQDAIKEMREDALSKWTTKERNEFHRVICLFGLPNELSSSEMDEDEDESPFFTGTKRDWREFKEMGEFGGDKTNGRFNEYCQEYLRISELSAKQHSNDDEEVYDGGKASKSKDKKAEEKLYPPDKARKALHAVTVFEQLRLLDLNSDKVKKGLSKARRSSGLPKWWHCELHDLPFLKGAAVHGLARPDRIINDPELPFLQVYEAARTDPSLAVSASARRSTRTSSQSVKEESAPNVVGWPNNEVAMRRLEYLLDLIIKGKGSSTVDDSEKDEDGAQESGTEQPKRSKRKRQSTMDED